MVIGNNYQKEGIDLKFRLLALALSATLLFSSGCGNILDKVTKRGQETAPTATSGTGNSGQDQIQQKDITLQDLQTALRESTKVKLVAQDSGQSLALDEAKRQELIKLLTDSGELKESKELAAVVASPQYPAYQIQIEDKDIKFDIYDSLRFGMGSENNRHYYMEKGDIWKNITKWLAPRVYSETSLGYLFKASKVTVKGGIFTDETDQTAARNNILRLIRSVNLQSTTLPQDAGEALTITFTVTNKKYVLKVYGEYLTFNNTTYKLPQGKQNIENLLSPA